VARLESLPPREGRRVTKERQREGGREGGEERQRGNLEKKKKIGKISLTHHGKKTTHRKNIPHIGGWGLPCSPCPKGHLTANF
jgi:hypothetical protein